ncbi:DLL4 [Cordylochernes scorpioides]|uniref:DLL4 n=1 Tax=Cordylochernes scorpioides TaxID=51811 RepID=A0ABY6LHI4_9ARAC|nr:DLL4 [Cordylochernes scorpioides]
MPRPGWMVVLVLAVVGAVGASGVFELRLLAFSNPQGRDAMGQCCAGTRCVCRTLFRVCLKHYQAHIDPLQPCTFGELYTPVLGNNSVSEWAQIVRFPFEFSWPAYPNLGPLSAPDRIQASLRRRPRLIYPSSLAIQYLVVEVHELT